MIAKVMSSAVIGNDAYVVEVEIDISQGLPSYSTVGLAEGAVRESKERVKAAIKNSGYHFPPDRITVNLAPADVKKEGSGFDGSSIRGFKTIENSDMILLADPATAMVDPICEMPTLSMICSVHEPLFAQ